MARSGGRSQWERQMAAQRREAERRAREQARLAKEAEKAVIEHGFEVLTHDIGAQTPSQVAAALAAAVLARRRTQPDAS
jgi:hypothetical protein